MPTIYWQGESAIPLTGWVNVYDFGDGDWYFQVCPAVLVQTECEIDSRGGRATGARRVVFATADDGVLEEAGTLSGYKGTYYDPDLVARAIADARIEMRAWGAIPPAEED